MTTQVITGDKGFAVQKLKSANLYDCRGCTVHVENGHSGYGFDVLDASPDGGTLLGGKVLGEGINKSLPWDDVYAKGNGAAVRVTNVPGFTVKDVYAEFPWDGIKVPGSPNFTIEHCQLVHTRDDAIENDTYGPGKVNNCFLDGVHTFLSCNSSGRAPTKPWHIHWTGNVMSLGCGLPDGKPCEDRADRLKYAWACPTGSGQPWKVRSNGGLFTMTFMNNAAMIDSCINQTKANLLWFRSGDIKLAPESRDNRFYYLGSGKGLTMIEVTNPDGSKAKVPSEFGIKPGAVWAKVSNSRTEWEAEIARWKSAA